MENQFNSSALSVDYQGLRTDRLLQASFSCPSGKQDASCSASCNKALTIVKGRFSEDKKRFVEHLTHVSCNDWRPEDGCVRSILKLKQAEDFASSMIHTYILIKQERNDGSSDLLLCHLEDQRIVSIVLLDENNEYTDNIKNCDAFEIVSGPCVLAWDSTGVGERRVWCWYAQRWCSYDLGIAAAAPSSIGKEKLVAFVGPVTTTTTDEAEEENRVLLSVLFRTGSSREQEKNKADWRVLELPPMTMCTSNPLPSTAYSKLPVHVLEACTCIAESKLLEGEQDGPTIYAGCVSHCSSGDDGIEGGQLRVWRGDHEIGTLEHLIGVPTSIWTFLGEVQEKDSDGREFVGIHYAMDTLGRFQLVLAAAAAATQGKRRELIVLREFQGVSGGMLCGDFLGVGSEQMALVTAESSDGGLLPHVALTDGKEVWAHKRSWELGNAPHTLDKAACKSHHGNNRVKTRQSFPAKGGEEDEERKVLKRQELLQSIRQALEDRLQREQRRRQEVTQEWESKQGLLMESQQVLLSLAYQDVLPTRACSEPVLPSSSFAQALTPLEQGGSDADGMDVDADPIFSGGSTPFLPIESHVLTVEAADQEAGQLSVKVLLNVKARVRIRCLSLSFFSLFGHIPFQSSVCDSVSYGDRTVVLRACLSISSALMNSCCSASGMDVALCCAWRAVEVEAEEEAEEGFTVSIDDSSPVEGEGEGEATTSKGLSTWPAGAQVLQNFNINLSSWTAPENNASSTIFSPWAVDICLVLDSRVSSSERERVLNDIKSRTKSLVLESDASFCQDDASFCQDHIIPCKIVAKDAPILHLHLNSLLQYLKSHQPKVRLVPQAIAHANQGSFYQSFEQILAELRNELDVLCTLVEGKQPSEEVIRQTWLSQPSVDMAIFLLDRMNDVV